MKHWKRLIILLLLAPGVLLLLHPEVSRTAIETGLLVCSRSILPALFPFFVVSDLWISLGIGGRLSRLAAPITERIFHLPGSIASALTLGAVGGYPVGALTIAELYTHGVLCRKDAEHALLFCNNAGPAFIFGILGGTVFQNPGIAAALWGIHLAGSFLLGFLFRPAHQPAFTPWSEVETKSLSPFSALTSAIAKAGETAIQICVFVLFFSVLCSHLASMLPLSIQTSPWFSVFLGALELAGGAGKLAAAAIPGTWKFVISAGLLGWGGLCVHCQTLTALNRAGLSSRIYLLGKALHSILSIALACLLSPILPLDVPCFAVPSNTITIWPFLLPLLSLLPKSSSGKIEESRI